RPELGGPISLSATSCIASSSFPNAGSSNAPWLGSVATAVSPRTSSGTPEKPHSRCWLVRRQHGWGVPTLWIFAKEWWHRLKANGVAARRRSYSVSLANVVKWTQRTRPQEVPDRPAAHPAAAGRKLALDAAQRQIHLHHQPPNSHSSHSAGSRPVPPPYRLG